MSAPEDKRSQFNPLARRSWTDLGPRVASAAVLLALAIVGLYVGSYVFAAIVGAVFAGCYREWERMVTLKPLTTAGGVLIALLAVSALVFPAFGPLASLALVAVAAALAAVTATPGIRLWRVGGVVFYGLVIVMLMTIRGEATWNQPGTFDAGLWAGLMLGCVIWATDTGAYFTGRQVGGEKLAPDISPGKTWSGAIGGFGLGTLVGLIVWLLVVPHSPWWIGLLLAASISILGQVGDLAESAIKRRFRIKDSGDIIPGHGGLMDRLDSLTFGIAFLFVVGALHGGFAAVAAGFLYW
ncbi:CDP-archaeol synthase [Devosia sp.]|uniref:phosphatidate cytidylyltransferase n=1 Tax=Devosia sp. TaxID=1871048 RepID=UPI001ACB5BF1|nr:CDP-archaeol synthase [Devosia sp.]MBN9308398.1 phosphatidate cytidylyltransferase [Devosia sp.]